MARTGTVNHDISKYDDGDNPRDYPGQDLNYNWDTVDKLLWRAGTSYPSTYKVGSYFLRTDLDKVYENTGTEISPVWTERLSSGMGAHASTHLPGGADALATAVPVSIGLTNTLGTAESFSKSDHIHRIDNLTFTSLSPRTNTTATTASGNLTLTGSSEAVQFFTGTATGYTVTLPNATTLTNGHYFYIYNISSSSIAIRYNDASLNGTSASASGVLYIRLRDNSTSNGIWVHEGALLNNDTGLSSYSLTATTPFTTTSITDVVIPAFTLTPMAGKYAVWYNGDIEITSNNNDVFTSLYKNGVKVSDSERRVRTSVNTFYTIVSTASIITFNGTEALDVRVRVALGSTTINNRSMILIRMGN